MEEGVLLNSVPSTLATLASPVAGTAAALQAGKRANYFLCCLSFQPKHGGEVISNKANLKKSTVGVADVVHRHRRHWEGGGVGGRWGWRPPPACRGDVDDNGDDDDDDKNDSRQADVADTLELLDF